MSLMDEARAAGWDEQASALIAWFRAAAEYGHLPTEPFTLSPGWRIETPETFYTRLLDDLATVHPGGYWGAALVQQLEALSEVWSEEQS